MDFQRPSCMLVMLARQLDWTTSTRYCLWPAAKPITVAGPESEGTFKERWICHCSLDILDGPYPYNPYRKTTDVIRLRELLQGHRHRRQMLLGGEVTTLLVRRWFGKELWSFNKRSVKILQLPIHIFIYIYVYTLVLTAHEVFHN